MKIHARKQEIRAIRIAIRKKTDTITNVKEKNRRREDDTMQKLKYIGQKMAAYSLHIIMAAAILSAGICCQGKCYEPQVPECLKKKNTKDS